MNNHGVLTPPPSSRSRSRLDFLIDSCADVSGESLAIPLIFSAVVITTGLAGVDADPGGLPPRLQDIASSLTAIVTFIFTRSLPARFGHSYRNLVVWLCCGILASLAPLISDSCVRGHVSLSFLSQIPLGIASYSLIMVTVGTLWTGWRATRNRMVQLDGARRELVTIQESLDEDIRAIRESSRIEVKTQLLLLIELLNEKFPRRSQNQGKIAAQLLLNFVDDVVRPLSRELVTDVSSHTTLMPQISDQAMSPSLPAGVSTRDLGSPWLYLALASTVSIGPAFTFFGRWGIAIDLIAILIGFSTHVVLSRRRGAAAKGTRRSLLKALAMSLLSGIPFLLVIAARPADWPLGLSMAFGLALTGLGLTLFLFLTTLRIQSIDRARVIYAEEQRLVNRLRQERWVERERLARFVHGDIQSKLIATAIRFDSLSQLSDAEIQKMISELTSLVNAIDLPLTAQWQTIESRLDDFTSAWAGACDLKFEALATALNSIDHDPVAQDCIIEIVREGLANAVKHAGARKCTVQLAVTESNRVVVDVIHASAARQTAIGLPGFGSGLLDEITSSWHLSIGTKSTTLSAQIELR